MKEGTVINKLDRREQRQLEDLVSKHATEIKAGRWTKETFAAHATKLIGRPVTLGNVNGACKTMEVSFPYGNNSAALRSTHQLRKAVVILANEMIRICGEMGVTASQTVHDLATVQSDE